MTYKQVARYRVAYFKQGPMAGKTEIIVTFEDGGSFALEALPPEAAHHLVDLLRNESPIWLDPLTGTLAVSDEPVGSEE
jgi:hypothetical protein